MNRFTMHDLVDGFTNGIECLTLPTLDVLNKTKASDFATNTDLAFVTTLDNWLSQTRRIMDASFSEPEEETNQKSITDIQNIHSYHGLLGRPNVIWNSLEELLKQLLTLHAGIWSTGLCLDALAKEA
ncbi:unnamed protein product [Protopolystoma xenopodis]|uniref:Uncharacterized protein n=1 Tax=Protopolystoma xenopodis TaxID=117903 RepID=A0A448WC92_9PLAT|nr:unnamed protein product [Protopolystoma xenopodis]